MSTSERGQSGPFHSDRETSLFVPPTPDLFARRPEMLAQLTTQVNSLMDAARRSEGEKEIVLGVTESYLKTRDRRGEELVS